MAESSSIRILPTAHKSLLRAPLILQRRVRASIGALAADPRGKGVVKLKGREGYRLRVGSWRVLFVIDDATHTVTVTGFGPRRGIYRL
jgi:mRNA interferase RelE/StbE